MGSKKQQLYSKQSIRLHSKTLFLFFKVVKFCINTNLKCSKQVDMETCLLAGYNVITAAEQVNERGSTNWVSSVTIKYWEANIDPCKHNRITSRSQATFVKHFVVS